MVRIGQMSPISRTVANHGHFNKEKQMLERPSAETV